MISVTSSAEIRDISTYFSVFCKISHSVGYNWDNNEWTRADFIPPTYVITKIKPTEDSDECLYFRLAGATGEITFRSIRNVKFGTSEGCYRITRFGGPNSPIGEKCAEEWEGDKEHHALFAVKCDGFQFQVSGEIIKVDLYNISSFHKDPTEARDSMTLEVGNCAQI